jgi:hypothetical protein
MPSTAGNDLDSVFSWPAGRVRTAFAASVPGVLTDLKEWAADPDRAQRIVTVGFDRLPGPRALMGRATALLAEVALALWPDWYGGAVASPAGDQTAFEFEWLLSARLAPTGRVRRAVSIAWVKAAAALCRSGRPPTPRGFSPAIQVAQLALAIDPGDLLITLCAEDAQPREARRRPSRQSSRRSVPHTPAPRRRPHPPPKGDQSWPKMRRLLGLTWGRPIAWWR